MNRTNWQFPYTADVLKGAALAKAAHHASRLKWWQEKKEETVEKIRSEGLEIDESVAVSASFSNTYARGATVNVRNDLMRDLQECQGKVQEHRGRLAEYEAWAEVLEAHGKTTFPLHHDDWLFFFSQK